MSADVKGGHTPGPWIELDTESTVDLDGVSGWQDIGVEGGNVVAIAVGFAAPYWHEKSLQANARLISAAPDYAAAAPRAADLLEHYAEFIRSVKADQLEEHPYLPDVEEVVAALRAAAAKAEGPSS